MATDFPVYLNSNEPQGNRQTTQFAQKPSQIHLTQEEIRVLTECNRESFYYRCLPFALVGMIGTHLAVQRGILKPHAKYGSIFKQIGAGVIGWVVGKFSYRRACEDKLLHLNNSTLADTIRRRRGLVVESLPGDLSAVTDDAPSSGVTTYSDQDYHSSFGALNLDMDKNVQYSDLDERASGNDSIGTSEITEEKGPRPAATYDELRRKNRESNMGQQASSFSPPLNKWDSYSSPVQRDSQRNDERIGGVKNTYGDTWEK